jgi:hypothetical protein
VRQLLNRLPAPRDAPRLVALSAAGLIALAYFAVIAVKYPSHYRGWFTGADQSLYLRAAQGWAAGNLDPSWHFYPPGYPLLAAPFVRLFPAQPYVIANALCFLAAFWAFIRICRHLTADAGRGQMIGAAAFLVATLSSPKAVAVWIWPWSTTGSAPFILFALLGALRFGQTSRPRLLFWTMASGATVAAFRPTDALVVLLGVGAFVAWTWFRRRAGRREIAVGIGLAAAGLAAPLLLLLAAHVAIFGWTLGPYLTLSREMGFNWRLLPWRWAAIVIDPRPLFPEGLGLARVFPWIIPGIAGMALSLWPRQTARIAPHALVIGTMTAYWLLYLTFIDLQPYGLWRFSNYHYFKVSQPFLVFYALLLAGAILDRRRRWTAAAILLATVATLVPWRAELRPRNPAVSTPIAAGRVMLAEGLSPIGNAAIVPAFGDATALYAGHHRLLIDSQIFRNIVDFRAFPVPGGALTLPLHTLPAGQAEVIFDDGIALDPAKPVIEARIHIAYGLPCLFGGFLADCGN